MRQKIGQKSDFPEWFRGDLIKKVEEKLDHADGLQIIGPTGAGKTSLAVQLGSRQGKYHFIPINLNLIDLGNATGLKEHLQNSFKKDINVYFLDPFELIANCECQNVINLLDGWRSENFGKVKYIFGIKQEAGLLFDLSKLEPISKIMVQSKINIPPLSSRETEWFADNTAVKYKIKINQKEIETIFELSGGYMQLVKKLVLAKGRGVNLANTQEVIADDEVSYLLTKLKEGGIGQEIPLLETLGQVGDKYERKKDLTISEEKLFLKLLDNRGKLCLRDEVMVAVWGKSEMVSDHSLDQLVHRLRNKIGKTEYKIEVVRGRGLRLV